MGCRQRAEPLGHGRQTGPKAKETQGPVAREKRTDMRRLSPGTRASLPAQYATVYPAPDELQVGARFAPSARRSAGPVHNNAHGAAKMAAFPGGLLHSRATGSQG